MRTLQSFFLRRKRTDLSEAIRLAIFDAFVLQQNRLILWIPVAFSLGIVLYFSLMLEPPLIVSGFVSLIGAALWGCVWPLREKKPYGYLFWLVCGFVFLFASGFAAAHFRTHAMQAPVLVNETGPVDVEGVVTDIERLGPGEGSRLILEEIVIERVAADETPEKVRITVRKDQGISVGERIRVLAELSPPSAPIAPGAFDFQRYSYFRKLGGIGFAYRAPEILDREAGDSSGHFLEKTRRKIVQRVERSVDYPQAGIMSALMTGERGSISEEDWEAMRGAGLAHMLAISGLHVGLVAGVVFFCVRFLLALFPAFALRWPIKKISAFIALIAASYYMLLVGATVPTQRALLMTGVVLIAVMLDRSPVSLRLVALAALAILLVAPDSLMSASFQMSFAAVSALVCFYDFLRPYWSSWYRNAGWFRRAALYVLGVCATTLVASLATAPFSLFHFQNLAVFGLLANLIAVPLMAFVIMPMAVFTYPAALIGLDGLVLQMMGLGVSWVLDIAHWVAGLDGAVLRMPALPGSCLAFVISGSLFLFLWKGWFRLAGLVPVLIGLMLVGSHRPPDILVSPDSSLVAVRTGSGELVFSSLVKERFIREGWLRLNGQPEDAKQKWPKEGWAHGIRCGEHGCRHERDGIRIAFPASPYAHAEDCLWADIVVAGDPVDKKACHARVIIDRFDSWRNGAYALWLEAGDIYVEHAAQKRGDRPWTDTKGRR